MRIGIMLRTLDEKFGIGMYTNYMIEALLKVDRGHEFVLYYRNPAYLGRFAQYPYVRERFLRAPGKLLWDQVAAPWAARQDRLDLLFHTKFTVPFLAPCKTVMRVAGASWFVRPGMYPNKLDLAYIHLVMPWYCRRATAIIANSKSTKDDFIRLVGARADKLTPVYNGLSPRFRQLDAATLLAVKQKYSLPDRFLLTVGRYDPRKNFDATFQSFLQSRDATGLKLVAVGKDSWKFGRDRNVESLPGKDDFVFPGYIPHEELPAVYNLATVFIYPSFYEEFPNPVIESMACGCPVISSNTGSIPEVAEGAAILTEPDDVAGMAEGIRRLVRDSAFRTSLVDAGLERARRFNYDVVAGEVMAVLEKAARA